MNRSALLENCDATNSAAVDCRWGKVLFGQTFARYCDLADALGGERPKERDIADNIAQAHVVVAMAPQELFVDPSYT